MSTPNPSNTPKPQPGRTAYPGALYVELFSAPSIRRTPTRREAVR